MAAATPPRHPDGARPRTARVPRIQADPAGWIREALGADLWAMQVRIAEAVRDHRRTAVKSCHGSGKSFLAARIVLHFVHAYPRSVVITTAPTYNQVRNILWRSLNQAAQGARVPLLGRALVDRYEIGPEWYALGFKAEDTATDRFQGFHAEHILAVIDEAAGVADTVYEALEAVMTSDTARMLLIGNPTSPTGQFYDAFHKDRALWHTITIRAQDTPNFQGQGVVRPYLVTPRWVEEAIAQHGADSPYVTARVHAEFPELTDNALIPLAWIETADARRWEADDPGIAGEPYEAGLDVADMGADENALCIRRGPVVVAEYAWSGLDTMETVGKVRALLAQHPRVAALRVDAIGVGAGVAARLREEGYPVVAVVVSRQAAHPEKFASLRHELWWEVRERFRLGAIGGPIGEMTMGQLSDVRYRYDSRHTMPVIESKDEARKRRHDHHSPDRADALVLAYAKIRYGGGRVSAEPADADDRRPRGPHGDAPSGTHAGRKQERRTSHVGATVGRVF